MLRDAVVQRVRQKEVAALVEEERVRGIGWPVAGPPSPGKLFAIVAGYGLDDTGACVDLAHAVLPESAIYRSPPDSE